MTMVVVVELQILKVTCRNENFICFEDVRQHMKNCPTEKFQLDSKRYQFYKAFSC